MSILFLAPLSLLASLLMLVLLLESLLWLVLPTVSILVLASLHAVAGYTLYLYCAVLWQATVIFLASLAVLQSYPGDAFIPAVS